MLRCVYILSLTDQLQVPVDTLGKIVEDNKEQVFPIWIKIDPASCRGILPQVSPEIIKIVSDLILTLKTSRNIYVFRTPGRVIFAYQHDLVTPQSKRLEPIFKI